MPDSSEDEGCKARILTSYFLRLETSLPEEESDPSVTSGRDDV